MWLTPEQAEADTRLEGVQIEPEWLAAKKTDAYGWRNGIWAGLITRQGRVEVQSSAINYENSAPYHMVSTEGMMWYTPFGPLNKDSLKGIMMEASSEIDGPVYVWELPGDQAYQGVDALATEIKAAPNHPADVNWLRVSQGEAGEVRSGDTDVIELLPAPRLGNVPMLDAALMGHSREIPTAIRATQVAAVTAPKSMPVGLPNIAPERTAGWTKMM